MSTNLRYPNITGLTEKEQLVQIKSYLHQLVEQLNYALTTLGSGEGATTQSASKQTYEVQGGEVSYYELRSLIIQDMQKVEDLFGQLTEKVYKDVATAVTESLQKAKDSGEFNGPQGVPGKDGHTPVITIRNGYWYIDGVNTNQAAQGLNGETGNGISDISKTGTNGLVDTYTITYTDGTTTTFTVTSGEKGEQGEQGVQGIPGKDGYTPVKGEDYFTEAEVTAVAKQAAGNILFTIDEAGNLYYEVEE